MQIMQYIRAISASQFAGIVLLFFLPFVEVSCGNMFTVEISGQQFATGGQISVPSMPNAAPTAAPSMAPVAGPSAVPNQKNQDIEPKISAVLAWIAAIAGVVVSLLAGRNFRIAAAALGGLGAAMMFWLKSEIDKDFGVQLVQAQGLIQLDYKFAFWACAILFLTAAGTNIYALMRPPNPGTA